MRKHPEIEVVSRDRGEEYAAAARLGAPQALQCADRFHLAQNLTDLVEVLLARCRSEIRRGVQCEEHPLVREHWRPALDAYAQQASKARSAEREDRYHQLVELRTQGLTTKEIAHRLGMGDRTVRCWLTQGIPYTKPRKIRRSGLDPYAVYLIARWEAGEHNGLLLWREIKAQGYKGGSRTVYRFLARLKENPSPIRGKAQRAQVVPETPLQQLNAQEAVWLFVRVPSDLDEEAQKNWQPFAGQVQLPTRPTNWFRISCTCFVIGRENVLTIGKSRVRGSCIPELQRFVHSIERDKAAVLAGLTLPHRNGQIEGQITKLKLLKRTMYGRAGFALLRQRVLHSV